MFNTSDKLLDAADKYLERAEFFSKYAAEYLSAAEELSYERAMWLKAIAGSLMVTHDSFEERVEADRRMARRCQRRAGYYSRKHDRAMLRYYRYIGVKPPTFMEESQFYLQRKAWAILRKVGYGRYFGRQRSVRRDNHPSLF